MEEQVIPFNEDLTPSGKIWPSYQRDVYGFSDFVRPTSGRPHQLTLSGKTDVYRTLFEQSICLMSSVAKLHRKEQLRYATCLSCAQLFRAIKVYLMYLDARPLTRGVQGALSP